MSGWRICLSGMCFESHKHTYSLSLFTCCWACSCFCMDHPVTIVCKQCRQGKRDEADSENSLRRRYIYIYMHIYILEFRRGTLNLYCVSFCHWLHQQSIKETKNTECQLGVSFSLHVGFLLICCYFQLTFSSLLYVFFFF